MKEINKEQMLKISDKVVQDFLEKVDDDTKSNPYFKPFISSMSDIAAMIVLEYHKEVNKKN